MSSRAETIQGMRKTLELYRELGFEYLPLRSHDTEGKIELLLRGGMKGEGQTAAAEVQPPASPGKMKTLEDIRKDLGDCTRCRLSEARQNIVFGEGDSSAEIMFVGEGPGREEDRQARPFVGDAGKLLTSLIMKLGLKRENVYIANVVKCRPPGNRNPGDDEIGTCMPFLQQQIASIRPRIIVTLGKISTNALLKRNEPISRQRGSFASIGDIPLMPTFHPAYLLRNPKDKWLTWDDMQKVMNMLKSPQ